jgi:HK97 family phage prohead protease
MMREVERRFTRIAAEIRAGTDGKTIGGYAAVFFRESSNLGGFVEDVDSRAFNKSRGDNWPDVMARYNHDDNMLLGTSASGTLRLSIDETGLAYDVTPPAARADVLELVQRGDVQKSSFAFRTMEDDWTTTEQGFPKRTLLKVQLVDVAPVNVPAYPDTSAGLRSLAAKFDADISEVRDLAEREELRKLFVRTDRPVVKDADTGDKAGSRLTPAQAVLSLLSRVNSPHA